MITARLHTMPCYPYQGGNYYRNDNSIAYGDPDNEIVGSRATDQNGHLSLTVTRPWTTRIGDAKSIVLNTATDGIIFCSNIDWVEVDGVVSSTVSTCLLNKQYTNDTAANSLPSLTLGGELHPASSIHATTRE